MCLLAADGETGAQRMAVADAIGAVALQAVDEGRAIDVGGDAVEDEVADLIGNEMHGRVAREIGELRVDVASGMRQRHDIVEIMLDLVFVEIGGVEPVRSEGRELRLLTGRIRNLELGDRRSGHETQLCRIVDCVGRIAEKPALSRPIVNRLMATGRVFDAETVHGQAAGGEDFPLAALRAIFEGALTRLMAAAIEADAAAGLRRRRRAI